MEENEQSTELEYLLTHFWAPIIADKSRLKLKKNNPVAVAAALHEALLFFSFFLIQNLCFFLSARRRQPREG